ncbi:Transposon Ty3-I Gag-Pol polyprotein [Araneus ventricosus]|uniref:Transposon Ty3-I Gag-Pol polyprotein n=1 Tax=Araneus ventricosus TaxID=182803 RepID=A0A4Y2WB88_ARAVE|nr:Transposon Ty3-I Gag-Pol polyprotein [Araneus ventricosus]GBO34718.1 Transposon Ty3-I Gag-Pol polyprotein [Araneus ventricosus]
MNPAFLENVNGSEKHRHDVSVRMPDADKKLRPARDAKYKQISKMGRMRSFLLKRCYSNKLKPEAIPFAITSPRRVPFPLSKQTKAELEKKVRGEGYHTCLKTDRMVCDSVIVPKSDGNMRISVELVELNKNVMRELHLLTKAEYSLNLMAGAKIVSKLNANSGFWQIPLDKKSSYVTTFITPFGRFRFQRLPFGIASAPEHFQRRVCQMLEGTPGTICNMDDILIWGSAQEEHDQRLTEVCNK